MNIHITDRYNKHGERWDLYADIEYGDYFWLEKRSGRISVYYPCQLDAMEAFDNDILAYQG